MKKPRKKIARKVLITGNEAVGEAAIKANCRFYAGYPITPQNEITAYMARRLLQEKGEFVQAESEMAAINMVFGAAVTGFRAMTSSSSPGISLKQEGMSYMAGCELPGVIVNVMRGGPGLGNIDPSQGDYFQATKGGGHGDYRVIVLAPSSVQEAFDLTMLGFDLADKYRNPALILMDAFLGQMAEAIRLPSDLVQPRSPQVAQGRQATGSRLHVKKRWALTGCQGRAPQIIRSLLLGEGALEEHNRKLEEKYKKIEKNESRFEAIDTQGAEVILIAYGISFRIAKAAARILNKDIKVGIFRPITLWPYPYQALRNVCKGKKQVFVFELSTGQMIDDVKSALAGSIPVHFYGRCGGVVFTEGELACFVKSKCRPARKSKKSI